VDDTLEARAGVEHPATAGTEHVPGHVEDAETRRMQKRGDRRFLVQMVPACERKHVDTVEFAIGATRDGGFDALGRSLVGRLSQGGK